MASRFVWLGTAKRLQALATDDLHLMLTNRVLLHCLVGKREGDI